MKRKMDPGGQSVVSATCWENVVVVYVNFQRNASVCAMCVFSWALRFSTHSLIASISSIHLIKEKLKMGGNISDLF